MHTPNIKKKPCIALFFSPEILGSKNGIKTGLKGVLAFLLIIWAIGDTLLIELESFLRDPIPPFEQLEIAEGYIKTESKRKSSLRDILVITPHGIIGGNHSWWPCTIRSKMWANQFEGKRAKIWYFNKRIVQIQIGDNFDGKCEYNQSLRVDEEAREVAIRSFIINSVLLFLGIFLANRLCKQVALTKSA